MSNYDPWRTASGGTGSGSSPNRGGTQVHGSTPQIFASNAPASVPDFVDYSRDRRPPQRQPMALNPQPYKSASSQSLRSPRDGSSAVSAPRSPGSRGQATPGLAMDEKKPFGLKHADSTGTLAEEYEEPLDKGFKPSRATRGSMAVQMAAAGEIPKKAGLRLWRTEEHSGTFLRGGKKRACFRCCICSLVLALLIVIAVIVAFLLWVRPPSVTFEGVEVPAGISEVVVITGGFQLNFNLLVGVINPNYFGAFFPTIAAKAFYPTQANTELGGGQMLNVDIHKRTNNTIHFPFQINYTQAIDPGNLILADIAQRCGFIQGSTKSPIKVNYSLLLKIRVLAVDISPSFSSSTTFACPLEESQIDSLLKAGGISGIITDTNSGSVNSGSGGGDRAKRELSHMITHLVERTNNHKRLEAAPVERQLAA